MGWQAAGGLRASRVVADRKVGAVRVMKDECANAGFRIHHESFGKLYANFLGM